MAAGPGATIRGADEATVRRALESGESMPGTAGFAGRVDGQLVRDVLGRQPLFYANDTADPTVDGAWSFDRRDLEAPVSVPAGHSVSSMGSLRCWWLPSPAPNEDEDAAVAAVGDAIADGVDSLLGDDAGEGGELAIAFSGGVDSAVLAAQTDAPLYVTGYPDSHDVEAARTASEAMGRDLTVVELEHDDIVRAIPDIVAATGRSNAMDVAIAIPLFLTAERVAADGFDRLAVGQGADELFGGYAKVAKAPDDPRVEADSVAGARLETLQGLPEQLERDVLAIRSTDVEPVAPYLHDDVVAAALELPENALVSDDGVRKRAVRAVATRWLPVEITTREKKAMQYGSLVSRELDRLARQAGFKRRMDDHVGQYIDSVCEGA